MARQPRTKKPLTPAQVEALDRDDNGEAGGSLPSTLGEHELAAIGLEAFEAYDFQDERVRFDTLGRRWAFYIDKVGPGLSVLHLEVKRLEDVRSDTISTALLASELGRDLCADVVAKLDEALR